MAARTDMALCSLLGGMSLANAKLGAVHGFAGVIGGMVDAPHGAICAALLAPVVEVNVACAARSRPRRARPWTATGSAAALLTGRPDADDRGRRRLDPARPWHCSASRASAQLGVRRAWRTRSSRRPGRPAAPRETRSR